MSGLSHELLRQLVESSPDGIAVCKRGNDGWLVVFVNRAFERLTGFSAQDLKGRVCSSPDLMLYISRGITLTYRYHGRDGAEILRVPFDAATCSSTAPARVLVPVRSNAAPAQAVTPAHTPAGKDTYPDYSTRHNSRCWEEHQRAIQAIPEDASLVEAGERASEARRRLEACVE